METSVNTTNSCRLFQAFRYSIFIRFITCLFSRNARTGLLATLPLQSILIGILSFTISSAWAQTSNAIVTENSKPGNPESEWQIQGAGDLSIQGFATDISYNKGELAHFKVKTDASSYTINIYRLGYYQGNGARLQGTLTVSAAQTQPACVMDPNTGLLDCGSWAESASWQIPADAVSGVYIARLTRSDTRGASHVVFIVRDDAGSSDLLFQTSDATWQAYNIYGDTDTNGKSLYSAQSGSKASKVSYNRPFVTRNGGGGGGAAEDWLFNAEYPMIRWLEANGYNVSYFTDVDTDRNGSLLTRHKVFMSVGHDEYWSGTARANVEAARNAGKHLAFFSGNEVYWKTRWEASNGQTHRTLVCYKEGTQGENVCGTKCDPSPEWTGLWRDGCSFTSAGGCRPENALSGQISWTEASGPIKVPASYKNLRFWRNTSVASLSNGATASFTDGTIGYEWDPEQEEYRSSYPAGRILLSQTELGGKTHHLSLYKHSSGALVFGAGTVQWSWGLDSNHDRGSAAPSQDMRQATVNLFADMGVQPGTLQSGLIATTASSDAQAPTVAITAPSEGAALPANQAVTISGTASDANVVAGVEISTDGGTTWRLATGTTSWSYAWTPAAQGPAAIQSRAFDDSGNMSAPVAINVTIGQTGTPVCPCTVFTAATAPSTGLNNDNNQAIQLGMKFQASANGYITGVRFYKQSGNTGTHIGQLYSSAGTLLAQSTFTNETASGWQEAPFANPVAITANTTYIISYHSSAGYYSADNAGFTTAIVNGPLRGLANDEDGKNGVYSYSTTPAYPTTNFEASNYFVDVVFNTTVGPDTNAPTVVSTSPANNAAGVLVSANISVTFDEALNAATVSGATLQLLQGSTPVSGSVSYDASSRTATLNPTSDLSYSTQYSLAVKGGDADPRIKDLAGNALAANYSASFTTQGTPPPPPAPRPSPNDGPGGPILVISSSANAFSRYPVEILRAEGFNEFAAKDIAEVRGNTALLNSYDVIVLGNIPLQAADVTLLTNWVTAGGTLVTFRPDAQLASLLGLTAVGGTLSDKYLLVNTASGPGVGLVNETIQFHGTADLYTLNSGTTSLATLYSAAASATSNPAVTQRLVGSSGGKAIAFTYDLARSVVYTRQGNPAYAGQKRDGQDGPIRSDDLFYPDWVDLNKVAIPQADEQQRLLANIMVQGSRKPLPRFWYLPKGLKAAVIMTGDDHGSGGTKPRFDSYIAKSASNTAQAVADWTAVRGTSYIYPGTPISNAEAAAYEAQGFEISLHLNTNCSTWTPTSLLDMFNTQLGDLAANFPGLTPPATNRTHCISWSDWASEAKIQAQKGIYLDANYYYWPGAWIQNRPGMFTGSGMPMRFADLDGTLIDCYQATTQMTDESDINYSTHITTLLDNALGSKGYYGVFTANMHTDFLQTSTDGSNTIIAAAQQRNVPVISAKQMLTWLDGRNSSSFGNMAWNGNQLSFSVSVGNSAANLQGMLPIVGATGRLVSLNVNGSPVTYRTEKIKGIDYAFFPATPGSYVASYDGVACTTPTGTLAAAPVQEGQNVSLTYTATAGTGPFALVINGKDYPDVVSGQAFDTGVKASSTTTSSIWDNTATPSSPSATDATATEVGMKFQSSVAGQITGIRFYKGPQNTGANPVSLWSRAGALLATATFTNETATGWQEVKFATPVSIEANTTYIASYYAPNGGYAHTGNFFTAAAVTNGPLTALKDGTDGPNGVYRYGSGGVAPTDTYQSGNYWVDVLFTAPNSGDGSITFALTSITDSKGCVQQGELQVLKVQPSATSNQAPVLASIGPKAVAASSLLTFTASATDPEGSTLAYSLAGTVPAGAVMSTAGVFNWTPAPEQVGAHTFKVVVSDGLASAEEEITVTVTSETPTASACFQDQSVADFSAGTASATVSVSQTANGGITLMPKAVNDFSITPSAAEWQSFPWGSGGTTTFSGGQAVVDGARFNTMAASAIAGPGSSLEFDATFGAAGFQHIGFGAGNDADMYSNTAIWAMFSTGTDAASGLKARVNNNGVQTDVPLTGNYLGSAHRFRIDWNASSISFYIDGALVQTTNVALSTPMRVGASDYAVGGPSVSLDWMRLTPFATSGSFTSRIYDGTTLKTWGQATWTADTPAGTTVQLFQRQGNSINPEDGTWTSFTAIASNGAAVGGTSRYIQYRADLATSNTSLTPTLRSAGINCSTPSCAVAFTPAAGTTLPAATVGIAYNQTISTDPTGYNLVAAGLPAGLALDATTGVLSGTPTAPASANVTITATKDACSVDAAYTLVVNAAGTLIAQTISFTQDLPDVKTSAGPITLNATASSGLPVSYTVAGPATINGNMLTLSGTTGQVRITALQAGDATYSAAESVERSFNVTADATASACFQDQSVADFNGGTAGSATYIDAAGGITLKPQFKEEFTSPSAPPTMQSAAWSDGGSAVFANGMVALDGAHVASNASYGPGSSVEFVATFRGAKFQNIGFTGDFGFGNPWAVIGTGSTTTGIYARTNTNQTDILLPGSLLGTPHRYRIDWNADNFTFYVDGVQQAVINQSVSQNLLVQASAYEVTGAALDVDWLKITPYTSAGSFTSRVYDGSTAKTWQEATWSADTPAGTTVQLFQRQGNSTNPEDGTWAPFTAIASNGDSVGGTSRYIQYRADLATSNPAVTPTLQRMGINCAEATCADVAFTPTAGAVLPNATVGAFYSQTITTSPEAYNLVASGLPAGLTLEPATGLLSGKATAEATGAVITITATKGNCTAEATYTLTVQAANQPPVLAAIAPQSVAALATLSFTATATDADTDVSSLRFSLAGTVPDKAVIDAETGVFSWTPVLEQVGSHTFKVMVSDGIASGEQELTVTVTSPAPTDISLSSQSVEENKPTGTVVGSFSTASANAAQTYAYSLMAGEGDSDNASFQIAGSDLQTAAGFDFESKASYSIRVRATSSEAGGPTFEKAFTIAVNDANEAPVMMANTFNVAEGTANGVTVGTLSATDPDANQLLTYSITGGNTNNAFIIVGDALEVNNSAALDYATTPSFSLTVQATDSGNPALSASATITVNVTDVNGAPVIADQSFSLDENTPNETSVGTIVASDPDASQQLSYSITAGNEAGAFKLEGNVLKVANAAVLDYETTKSFVLTVQATDNGNPALSSSATISVPLTPVNEAPVLANVPTSAVQIPEQAAYTFQATATDPENDALTFSLAGAPTGAIINESTGEFTWTPTEEQGGATYSFTVRVSDGKLTSEQAMSLLVEEVSSAPVLTGVPETATIKELATYSFQAVGNDGDGDALTFSLRNAPDGATISGSGLFAWNPTEAQGPGEYTITVQVSDGSSTDEATVVLTVEEVNAAPVLSEIADATIPEMAEYTFTASATDAENSPLTFSLLGAPAGATMQAGVFSWTPTEAQGPGSYTFSVQVSDGELTDVQEITLTVEEVGTEPVLSAVPASVTIPELAAYNFTAQGYDGDGDALTYSLLNAPTGASIGASNGLFTWTPTEAQGPGTYDITVRLTAGGAYDEAVVHIVVEEVNEAPVLDQLADATIPELMEYTFTAAATDAEKDALTFALLRAPSGATLNATTGAFAWTPTEEQGPGTYTFQVQVSDGSLTDEQEITLTVTEVAAPIVLTGVPAEATIPELTTYSFTASVSSTETSSIGSSPSEAPEYSLQNAPAGASINASSGVFTWMPTATQGPGQYTFTVSVAVGQMTDSKQVSLTVEDVVLPPTITSFTPTAGPVGTVVTIAGTGLAKTTAVFFNSSNARFTISSDAQLVATVPADATTGVITVAAPSGTATSRSVFTVTPTISSFSPASGPVGTQVTITGTSLLGATSVQFFNGVEATGVVVQSSTTILATVPVGARTGQLTVNTPNGKVKSADKFTVTAPTIPLPIISSFSPASGPVGTTVTIFGSNFDGATAVAFNGTPCAGIISNTSTEVVVQVPTGATSGTISVTTELGVVVSKDRFKVIVGAPSTAPIITSFSPTSGPVGTQVIIMGSNLGSQMEDLVSVAFNGTPCIKPEWISASQIKATVPPGAQSGQITVTIKTGAATSKDRFRVTKGVSTVSLSTGLIGDPDAASQSALQPLQVFPNPIQGQAQLSFSLAKDESFTLDIYDLKGSKVRSLGRGTAQARHLTTVEVDARLLEEGVYIVRLVTGSAVQTTRITVRK